MWYNGDHGQAGNDDHITPNHTDVLDSSCKCGQNINCNLVADPYIPQPKQKTGTLSEKITFNKHKYNLSYCIPCGILKSI